VITTNNRVRILLDRALFEVSPEGKRQRRLRDLYDQAEFVLVTRLPQEALDLHATVTT
jgi:hypothetical protein